MRELVTSLRTRLTPGKITEHHPQHLIVDLRFDIGGTTGADARLAPRVSSISNPRPPHLRARRPLHFLGWNRRGPPRSSTTGRREREIVGETLADRLVFWLWKAKTSACRHQATLFARHDRTVGSDEASCGQAGCYADQYQVIAGTLRPDLPAPITIGGMVCRSRSRPRCGEARPMWRAAPARMTASRGDR